MKWFADLHSKLRSTQRKTTRKRPILRMESLERREVMDASIGFAQPVDLGYLEPVQYTASTTLSWDPTCNYSIDADDVVTIHGGMASDQVSVVDDHSTGLVTIDIQCGDGQHTSWPFQQGAVQKVVFHGGWSNDSFTNASSIPSEAYGDGGNDVLIGGGASDKFYGGVGNDHLEGNGTVWRALFAGDELYGDEGDDTLIGGGWHDLLVGGSGNDVISGNGGNDTIYGGNGDDIVSGGSGHDEIFGGSGWDQLHGDAGDDYLEGGYDNASDQLTGGAGNDTFVNEWRQKTSRGGWTVKELEQVTDFALGDTLEWKETPSRKLVLTSAPSWP